MNRMQVLLAEQAAEWVVRLQDSNASAQERAEFAAWVRASPLHVIEFLNAKATWEAISGETMKTLPTRDALIETARSEGAEVVSLADANERTTAAVAASAQQPQYARSSLRRRRRTLVAAACGALAIGGLVSGGLWTLNRYDNQAEFTTAIGEQETYTLRDGSTVALNTRSHVRLDWSDRYRDVYLERGEALFEVEKDPSRPFRVWTGASMVRAVGTRFNVYRSDRAVTVTVLEGRVEVTPETTKPQAAPAPIALAAGEQTRIAGDAPIEKRQLERPEKSIAWQERRLEFERTPLSEVIAEFNRYHRTQLVLEDPALALKRINGTFDAADRASLVGFLEEFENVVIETRGNQLLVRSR